MFQQPAFFCLLVLKVNISDPSKLGSKLLLSPNFLHIVLDLAHELVDGNDGQQIACFEVSEQRKGNNDAWLVLLVIRYKKIPNSIGKFRGKSGKQIEEMLRNEVLKADIASIQVIIEVRQLLLHKPSENVKI